MAITSTKSIFGSNAMALTQSAAAPAAGSRRWPNRSNQSEEFVPSEYWLNIGYNVDVEDSEGNVVTDFIALNKGIPIDSIKDVATNSNNDRFFLRAQAQNQLLADLRAATKDMEPGETKVFEGGAGLCIQLLRVKQAREVPTAEENPFVRKFAFA